jgi:hypothetical protein
LTHDQELLLGESLFLANLLQHLQQSAIVILG